MPDTPPAPPYLVSRGVSNTYAAKVMRLSTLVPLRGPATSADRVVAQALSVRAAWARRAAALGAPPANWPPAMGDRLADLVHCRPTFFIPEPARRFCGQHHACPHCWSRSVLHQWRAIDGRMFPRPADPDTRPLGRWQDRAPRGLSYDGDPPPAAVAARLPGMALVTRTVRYELPFVGLFRNADGVRDGTLPYFYRMRLDARPPVPRGPFRARKVELRAFRELGVAGILDHTGCVLGTRRVDAGPGRAGRHVADRWVAVVRQLMAVPVDRLESVIGNSKVAAAPPMLGIPGVVDLAVAEAFTRSRLMRGVAATLAYPRFLLHGPLPLAHEAIYAQAGRRSTVVAGSFRG